MFLVKQAHRQCAAMHILVHLGPQVTGPKPCTCEQITMVGGMNVCYVAAAASLTSHAACIQIASRVAGVENMRTQALAETIWMLYEPLKARSPHLPLSDRLRVDLSIEGRGL